MKKHLILFGYGLLLLMCGANSVYAQFPSAINLDTIGDNGLMISRVVKAEPVVATFPVLQPGTGWTGPTEQPETVGDSSMSGYDAKAIARWDVVPYQTFDDQFHVGVVAFHMNDIDRVSFSVDGGPWVDVHEMKMNPRTNVEEYTVVLDASLFSQDGPIEVRAIAWPKGSGRVRVLAGELDSDAISSDGEHSIFLFADPSGNNIPEAVYVSLTGSDSNTGNRQSPFATINKAIESVFLEGGEVVLLDEGNYEAPDRNILRDNTRWINIRSDNGLDRGQVVITRQIRGDMKPSVQRLKWSDVTFDFRSINSSYSFHRETWYERVHWLDDPARFLPLPDRDISPYHRGGLLYATNSSGSGLFYAFVAATLTRNISINEFHGDAVQQNRMSINTTIVDGNGNSHEHHTDVIQYWGNQDNVIVYGLNATDQLDAQGFFYNTNELGSVLQNSAFIDITIDHIPWTGNIGGPAFSMFHAKCDHILFKNIRIPWQQFLFRTDATGLGGYQRFEVVGSPVILDNFELYYKNYDAYSIALPPGVIERGLVRAPETP